MRMRRIMGMALVVVVGAVAWAFAEPSVTVERRTGPHGAYLWVTVTDPPPNAGKMVRLYRWGENQVLKSSSISQTETSSTWMQYPPVGSYELHVLDNGAHNILLSSGRFEIPYVHWEVELEAADTAAPRELVTVTMVGTLPDTAKDYVGLYRVIEGGTTGQGHVSSKFWAYGNPMTFEMPKEPGAYEFRLLENGTYYVIASHPIIVE